MTYDNLVTLQLTAVSFFWLCAFGGLIYLLIGLIKPKWLGLTKRRWVILRILGLWSVAIIVVVITLYVTHSHDRGVHSFSSYMDSFVAKNCTGQVPADAPPVTQDACQKLAKKCAAPGADTTHPSCVTMKNWTGNAN